MIQESFQEPSNQEPTSSPMMSPVFSQPMLPPPRKKFISIKLIILLAIIALLAVLAYIYRGVFVAATVNGVPITRYAVVQELEQQMGAKVLDSLINRALIDRKAAEAGIEVNTEEVNQEIMLIEKNLSSQGQTLNQALKAQGISRADLEKDIKFRKTAEKLVKDKVVVSDEEVNAYIKENKKLMLPNTPPEEIKNNVRAMLRQQKFSTVFQEWLNTVRAEANITYWKEY